jgi:hypothetical protein
MKTSDISRKPRLTIDKVAKVPRRTIAGMPNTPRITGLVKEDQIIKLEEMYAEALEAASQTLEDYDKVVHQFTKLFNEAYKSGGTAGKRKLAVIKNSFLTIDENIDNKHTKINIDERKAILGIVSKYTEPITYTQTGYPSKDQLVSQRTYATSFGDGADYTTITKELKARIAACTKRIKVNKETTVLVKNLVYKIDNIINGK